MKDTAILVNTARGEVVDEDALVAALDDGTIAAAGLDVFEKEPDVHPGLVEQERAVLAPHLGSATTEARTKMAHMCVASITAAFGGHDDIPHRAV
jgi:lactate dehydrogenase-like 2-hydroxyacid dehydrogenase